MTRKRMLIGGGVLAIAIIAAAVFLLWWFLIRDDAPPPVNLREAVESLEDEGTPETTPTASPAAAATETAAEATATATATAATSEAAADAPGVEGTWTLVEGRESFVGYRVEEELATIGYKEAVGRTPTIEATITIAGGQLTAVTVTADLRDLKSDDSRRDGALGVQALESSRFPTATFELTEPVAVPEGLARGEPDQPGGDRRPHAARGHTPGDHPPGGGTRGRRDGGRGVAPHPLRRLRHRAAAGPDTRFDRRQRRDGTPVVPGAGPIADDRRDRTPRRDSLTAHRGRS